MSPRNLSCHHFPKNNRIRINISFHFIFNWCINYIRCHFSKYFWGCISRWKSFDINYLLCLDLKIYLDYLSSIFKKKKRKEKKKKGQKKKRKKKKKKKKKKRKRKEKENYFCFLNSCQSKITNNCIQFTFMFF